MNQVRKYFPIFVTVLSIVLLLGGTGFAQNTQTVTLVPSVATVDPSGTLDITINYNCTKKVSNFSIEVYYDATKFTFVEPATVSYDTGLLNTEHNATDSKFVLSYMDLMGQWPAVDLPMDPAPVVLHFTANANASGTGEFSVVDKAELSNTTFVGDPVSVSVGGVVDTYKLTRASNGTGATTDEQDITLAPAATDDMYAEGDEVTLTANPSTADTNFDGWTIVTPSNLELVEGTLTTPVIKIKMPAEAVTIHGAFSTGVTPVYYDVKFTAGSNGNITGELTQTVATGGSTTSVTAVADTNYKFNGWTGDYTGTETTLTITNVTADMNITATFVEDTPGGPYTVTFTAGAGGNITGQATQSVAHGSSTSAVTAVANTDYIFDGWTGDYTGTETTLTITNVTAHMNITANFRDDSGCTGFDAGDYDEDGEIDIFDALGVAMHAAGLSGYVITEDCHLDALDVDENGKVDINDALAIARYDVGLVCNCTLD
ncbi:MAG: hypothetical protein GY749_41550 [Desulfobacteraceae bacterium]|nr:hypothetical protein [Desulfobacteraceae bacterium]